MNTYSTEDQPLPELPRCLMCGVRRERCDLCFVPREQLTRRWLDG